MHSNAFIPPRPAMRPAASASSIARLLDEYLALSGPTLVDLHAVMRTPAEAFALADEEDAFYSLVDGDNLPPALRALARLRFEAACEVERLLRLLDAIDADPDLEDGGDGTGHERAPYAGQHEDDEPTCGAIETWAGGTDWVPRFPTADSDECEPCCEDEGAQCDDEGEPSDNGLADQAGLVEQHCGSTFQIGAVI